MHLTSATHRKSPFLLAALVVLVVLPVAAILTPAAVAAVDAPEAPVETMAIAGPAPRGEKSAAVQVPSEKWGLRLPLVPELRLDPVDVDALLREDAAAGNQSGAHTKVMRIGVLREIDAGAADGDWLEGGGGALWSMDLVATGALGVRLHFVDVALPPGAELAIYTPRADGAGAEGEVLTYSAASAAMEFVTPALFSERVRIEYHKDGGLPSDPIPFRLTDVRHIYRDPLSPLPRTGLEKAAGSCHNDVSCFPEWGDLSNAVALVDIGGLGACTGTLLNSLARDFTPYWLTANHCISNAGEAAFSDFYWFYQTAACGGAPPTLSSRPRSSGAKLVSTNGASDYSLLLIEGALPSGLFWSGWTSVNAGNGTPEVAIHHPSADFKRISFGDKSDGGLCGTFGSTGNFITTFWTDAPTEPGSSGSGIFREDTGQLLGQLTGGPSACGSETFDCYGAFHQTYKKIKTPLKGGSDDKSEQNDSCTKARNVAKGTLTNRIVKVNDQDWYKINVPKNKTLTIRLTFVHGNGDIDLEFHGDCASGPLFVSNSIEDTEVISVTNVSPRTLTARWKVLLFNDTRNNYNQQVTIN